MAGVDNDDGEDIFRPFWPRDRSEKHTWRHLLKGEAMALAAMPIVRVRLLPRGVAGGAAPGPHPRSGSGWRKAHPQAPPERRGATLAPGPPPVLARRMLRPTHVTT